MLDGMQRGLGPIGAWRWDPPARPCAFCLTFHGQSVFADFEIDDRGCVYLVRISFDSYGCCTPSPPPAPMSKEASDRTRHAVAVLERADLLSDAEHAGLEADLREHLGAARHLLWPDALRAYGLLDG